MSQLAHRPRAALWRGIATLALAAGVALTSAGCWPFQSGGANPPSGGGAPPTAISSATAPPSAPPTAAPTTPPVPAGLAGTWSGSWANQTPDRSTGGFTLTWAQNGATLTGSITITGTPCLTGGSITGSVNGSTITFGAVNGEVTVRYVGTVSGTTMSGTYATDCGQARGTWTAAKKK